MFKYVHVQCDGNGRNRSGNSRVVPIYHTIGLFRGALLRRQKGVLQCIVVYCIVLQCDALWCIVFQCVAILLQCVAACGLFRGASIWDSRMRCRVLQCVAVCFSVLQCVAVCCSVLQYCGVYCTVWPFPHGASPGDGRVWCSVLQWLHCVAVCCSVLQCIAVCCSVLQYSAV